MAYKNIEQHFSFTDIAINSNADKNRSLLFLRKLDKSIDWDAIEILLLKYYQTGNPVKGKEPILPVIIETALQCACLLEKPKFVSNF